MNKVEAIIDLVRAACNAELSAAGECRKMAIPGEETYMYAAGCIEKLARRIEANFNNEGT